MFKDMNVAQPAETVPRQLPWMTGQPYALWARVRWISTNGQSATQWSKLFGFNIQWAQPEVPQQLPAPEGLVRWAPIDGATAYEVLYPDLVPGASFETTTNVADEREFFTFHDALGVHDDPLARPRDPRRRAVQELVQWASRCLLRAVEPDLHDREQPRRPPGRSRRPTPSRMPGTRPARPARPISSRPASPGHRGARSRRARPGIEPVPGLHLQRQELREPCLHRLDRRLPAWAPRSVGGLCRFRETRTDADRTRAALAQRGSRVRRRRTGATGSRTRRHGRQVGSSSAAAGRRALRLRAQPRSRSVDLWDSGWPSGRFYWTVVPVSGLRSTRSPRVRYSIARRQARARPPDRLVVRHHDSTSTTSASSSRPAPSTATYHDMAVPQDSCQSGRA